MRTRLHRVKSAALAARGAKGVVKRVAPAIAALGQRSLEVEHGSQQLMFPGVFARHILAAGSLFSSSQAQAARMAAHPAWAYCSIA